MTDDPIIRDALTPPPATPSPESIAPSKVLTRDRVAVLEARVEGIERAIREGFAQLAQPRSPAYPPPQQPQVVYVQPQQQQQNTGNLREILSIGDTVLGLFEKFDGIVQRRAEALVPGESDPQAEVLGKLLEGQQAGQQQQAQQWPTATPGAQQQAPAPAPASRTEVRRV